MNMGDVEVITPDLIRVLRCQQCNKKVILASLLKDRDEQAWPMVFHVECVESWRRDSLAEFGWGIKK